MNFTSTPNLYITGPGTGSLSKVMSLRRSIIGSVRSITSPIFSPNLSESSFFNDPHPKGRNPSSSGRSTPTAVHSRINGPTLVRKATKESTEKGTPGLTSVPEEERPTPPPFDRKVDLLAIIDPTNIPIDPSYVFERTLLKSNDLPQHRFFQLPAKVRHKIYSLCFPEENRRITLSPPWATKAIFQDYYFASPWDILEEVWGGVGSFRALRRELMTYFWTEYHFHVTLTPFSGPKLSPLSQAWLLGYLDIIQRLTVETDFTRFGCSVLEEASSIGYNNDKIERLLDDMIKGITKREGGLSMAELNILCRRYEGFRPFDRGSFQTPFWTEPVKYCPDEVPYICDVISELRGTVQRSRISGFELEHTHQMLSSIFGEEDEEPEYIVPLDDAWPPLPSPDISTSFSSSLNQSLLSPDIGYSSSPFHPSFLSPMSSFGLELDLLGHNRSFAEEFGDELSKCDASIYSNYTTTAATAVENDSKSLNNDNTVTEHVRRYQSVFPTREFSECSTAGRSTEASPATPRFNHLHEDEIVRTTSFEVAVDRLGVTPTPSSLDLLNDINEQDPAFLRALNAMRGPDLRVGEEAGRLSIAPRNSSVAVESAQSSVTINVRTNTSTTTSTNKKFLSFVSKLPRLRGRTA